MADTLTTLSLVTLAQQYRGDVVRQINRRTVFLKFVRILAGEGKNVAWAPEADGALAETYSDGDDAANFGGDAQASATLSWGLYRSNFHVSQLSMDAAATTQTPLGNRMLWARQLVNAGAKLATAINKDCFSGSAIVGLDAAIGSVSNTYATIDRSQGGNAYFRPTVVNSAGPDAAVSFALVRDDVRQIYEACGENPDIAFVSPTLFNSLGALFDATRRQVDSIMTARGPIRLDFGYQTLELDGMMFLKDKDATAKTIYYINTNHMELQYLPGALMSDLTQEGMTPDDGFGTVPLGMTFEMLAKLGASEKAMVRSTVQLVVNRPNAMGVRQHAL